MEDIQAQAIKTFSENFEFLSEYDAEVFNKVAAMQQAIETGQYKENYSLEYKDGYFDVQSLHDGSWLYGQDTNEYAKKKADEINFDKLSGSLSMSYHHSYTDAMIEDYKKFSAINFFTALLAPLEHVLIKRGSRKPTLKKIYKFAFLGLGLGLHIKTIHEKICAPFYLLVEDNLELFYLSLFVTNYKILSKHSKLFFCIMENSEGFKDKFEGIFYDKWMSNDFLKFSLFNDSYAYKVKQLQSFTLGLSNLSYPFNLLLRKNMRISKALKSDYKFLNISNIHKSSPLKNKKVIFLAAGPSLGKNMEWLKDNRDKFFIISVFMLAKRLSDEGIKPDIFVHIDENEDPIVGLFGRFEDYSYFEDIDFILSASIPLYLFGDIIKKENIYLVEDRTRYKVNHGNLELHSVGEAGYNIALILGAYELYILGLDLALDQKTGQTHTSGHESSGTKIDIKKTNDLQEVSSLRDTAINVQANRGGMVATTPLFEASIYAANSISRKLLTDEHEVYNLGNGAYLEGMKPYLAKDVIFDTCYLDIDMSAFLNSISTTTLSEKEQNNLVVRKQEVKKKAKLIKRFGQTKIKNSKDFYDRFIDLVNGLITAPNSELVEIKEIFSNYFLLAGSFVEEYINTLDADLAAEALIEVRNALFEQLNKLLYGIGLFEFGFINSEIFFIPSVCEELKDKVLKAPVYYQTFSQFKEICFRERLRLDSEGKLLEGVELKPLEAKEGIGFLATFANLSDEKYIQYLQKILTEIKEAKLVAFYFEEYQKAVVKDKFKEFEDRVTCKEIGGIGDIINRCRVYLVNGNLYDKGDTDAIHVYNLAHMLKIPTLYPVVFGMKGFEKSIAEYEGKNRDVEKFFNHLDYFGFQERNKEEYIHTFLWNTISKEVFGKSSKITSEMKMSDMVITHILHNFIKSDAYLARAIRFYKDWKRFSGC